MPPRKPETDPLSTETEALAAVLDLPASLGTAKLIQAAIGTIRALEEAKVPVSAPVGGSERVQWKQEIVAKVDGLPDGGSWKVGPLHSVLDSRLAVSPKDVDAALESLRGGWDGDKKAVKGGSLVADALRTMGYSVARVTPDGDVIVRKPR